MNDDDDFDFQALFFEECHELLGTLQEHLNQLADGRNDEETVHAAFRAVHSVKGGAAAFGFDQLIGFAHIFETVMDLIRSDQMAPTAEIHPSPNERRGRRHGPSPRHFCRRRAG
ncbi:MAG: Hpt domain-containing protein [Pseudomonadota bacterium]